MLEFSVGDSVSIHPEGTEPLLGVLDPHNRKTVTVITDQRQRWNVSPGAMRKVKDVTAHFDGPNAVDLRKK